METIVVAGPESSGTHYMTRLLGTACPGVRVLHRSMPVTDENNKHSFYWPDLHAYVREHHASLVVFCFRHLVASTKGCVRVGWARDLGEARARIQEAWERIGAFMVNPACPYVVSTYESLAHKEARRALLEYVGHALSRDVPFVDGNLKYWEPPEGV